MNPLPLFLIIVSLPLLLGGCGVEKESIGKVQPVEEKVQEIKEEVKPEEPVAEAKSVEEKVLEVKEEAKTEEPLADTR